MFLNFNDGPEKKQPSCNEWSIYANWAQLTHLQPHTRHRNIKFSVNLTNWETKRSPFIFHRDHTREKWGGWEKSFAYTCPQRDAKIWFGRRIEKNTHPETLWPDCLRGGKCRMSPREKTPHRKGVANWEAEQFVCPGDETRVTHCFTTRVFSHFLHADLHTVVSGFRPSNPGWTLLPGHPSFPPKFARIIVCNNSHMIIVQETIILVHITTH